MFSEPVRNLPMFRPIVEPVTRYAGSKRRLVGFIRKNMPETWADYYEPFCGGLSVYCAMVNEYWGSKSYWISDLNPDLIRVYHHIKNNPKKVFDVLWDYHLKHNPEQWHSLSYLPREDESEVELAARYWYLVRHAYTNKMGKSDKKWLAHGAMTQSYYAPSWQRTMALHEALRKTDTIIHHCPYQAIEDYAQPRDFVYLDPPYLNASKGIYQEMFSEEDHVEMAEWARGMGRKGVHVMISNYDNEATREIYKGMRFDTQRLRNTMVNAGGEAKYVQELLAMTY